MALPNGIPSHDTFQRVFMLIDPEAFEAGCATWVGALTTGFECEMVAIDGKTIRRSFDHGREQSPLHMVSAWASEEGLVLGQRCIGGKSNEIACQRRSKNASARRSNSASGDASRPPRGPADVSVGWRHPPGARLAL